jgi:hypothetical protein
MRRVQWGRGQDFLAQRKGFFVFLPTSAMQHLISDVVEHYFTHKFHMILKRFFT